MEHPPQPPTPPERLSWTCVRCGEPWPCFKASAELQAGAARSGRSLLLYMTQQKWEAIAEEISLDEDEL